MRSIFLTEIARDPERDTISGRDTGRAARLRFGLSHPLGAEDDIAIVVPDHVRVVTPSFFVGLLSKAIANLGSPGDAYRRVRLQNATDTTNLNFLHAITTLLSAESPFSGVGKKERHPKR